MATAALAVGHFRPRAAILQRSKGQSATAKAAYNTRTKMTNGRDGQTYDFSRLKNEALSTHFFAPAHAPEWAKQPESFWNGVELRENRTDSQLAMDWIIDLPHQMQATHAHARLALTDFIRENFQRKGYGAELVFHPAHDHGDERNFHAHLMVAIRKIDEKGEWSNVKDGVPNPKQLDDLKQRMQDKINQQLLKHGYDFQVDCRSNQDRGIDREPTIHLGKHAAALERRGVQTEVGDKNRAIEAWNAARALHRELQPEAERPRIRVREIEPEEIVSAIERMQQEDDARKIEVQRKADRDLAKSVSLAHHARELMSAVRRLFVTMGVALGNVLMVERGDVHGQGATYRTEALEQRRRLEELEAARYEQQARNTNERAAKLAADAALKQAPRKASDLAAEAAARVELDAAEDRKRQIKQEAERKSDTWMDQRGGVESLASDQLQSAKKSYQAWIEKKPDLARSITLEKYVSYTQQKQAETAAANEPNRTDADAPQAEKKKVVFQQPARRLERILRRPRPGHPEDEYD